MTHTTAPVRVQQSRAAGWRKPPGAVSVARGTRWGNPWRVGLNVGGAQTDPVTGEAFALAITPEVAVRLYAAYLRQRKHEPLVRELLAGRELMCWCPLDAAWCHADVLLRIANSRG